MSQLSVKYAEPVERPRQKAGAVVVRILWNIVCWGVAIGAVAVTAIFALSR